MRLGDVLEAEDPLRQQPRQLADEEAVVGGRLRIAEAEQDPREAAVRAGQEREAARLRREADGLGEAPLGRLQAGLDDRPTPVVTSVTGTAWVSPGRSPRVVAGISAWVMCLSRAARSGGLTGD